jgi:subtilisin family serine protease
MATPGVFVAGLPDRVGATNLSAIDRVRLWPLLDLTTGRADVVVGLLDGPVANSHPDLQEARIRQVPGASPGICAQQRSAACRHGTFVAGILSARRGCAAPAICPGCTLLVLPIFAESTPDEGRALPSAAPGELAAAIIRCVDSGARVLNLSAALAQPSTRTERELDESLDYAMRHGVLVVAAVGNQATLGSSAITRHPWVIPVAACDLRGRPIGQSNLGSSTGRRGLLAPGEGVTSLDVSGGTVAGSGTSVAAPFVTGAVALLWSLFPAAGAPEIRSALVQSRVHRRTTVVPPLLDAWRAHQALATIYGAGGMA